MTTHEIVDSRRQPIACFRKRQIDTCRVSLSASRDYLRPLLSSGLMRSIAAIRGRTANRHTCTDRESELTMRGNLFIKRPAAPHRLLRKEHGCSRFCGKGRDSYFAEVEDSTVRQVAFHVANRITAKRLCFPTCRSFLHRQSLTYHRGCEASEKWRIGIRSCDVEGIFPSRSFYLATRFATDTTSAQEKLVYRQHGLFRYRTDIDKDCFCVCADAGPAGKLPFRSAAMDLHDSSGDFWQWPAVCGETLLEQPFSEKRTRPFTRRRAILSDVRKHFRTAPVYSAVTKFITREN